MSLDLINRKPPLEGKHHIQPLLDKGEGQTVEFKQKLNDPSKIATTLCSMANTSGGSLLIGIRDDKSVAGIDPDQELFVLKEAVQFYIEPKLIISVAEVFTTDDDYPHEERSILLVEVPESNEKPHKAKNKKEHWQVYMRHNDQTLMAGSKAEKQLEIEDKPTKVKLSKNQQRLLSYLQKNARITQKEYAALVNISDRRARRELMENLDLGLIRVLEHEKEDYFVL